MAAVHDSTNFRNSPLLPEEPQNQQYETEAMPPLGDAMKKGYRFGPGGRYQIVAELSPGTGTVFTAVDFKLSLMVVVKFLENLPDDEARQAELAEFGESCDMIRAGADPASTPAGKKLIAQGWVPPGGKRVAPSAPVKAEAKPEALAPTLAELETRAKKLKADFNDNVEWLPRATFPEGDHRRGICCEPAIH